MQAASWISFQVWSFQLHNSWQFDINKRESYSISIIDILKWQQLLFGLLLIIFEFWKIK